jgi:hypothetical protein
MHIKIQELRIEIIVCNEIFKKQVGMQLLKYPISNLNSQVKEVLEMCSENKQDLACTVTFT